MNAVERVDRFQRRHTPLGGPLAIIYKFFDDRGPYLAALVTYYSFLSLFPLMLVFSSSLGFFLQHHPGLQQQLTQSALRDFPIIGPQLRHNVGAFHGSGVGLLVGIVGTLYGGLGAMQAAQMAFNQIYGVPRNSQPNPVKSRLRSVGLLFLLGGAVLLSTGVATLVSTSNSLARRLGTALNLVGLGLSFAINVLVFTAAFQLLTARTIRWRQVLTGGVLAATSWEVLQTIGTGYASARLNHASSVYGTFGLVLSAIAWIYLEALVVILAAEVNVVRTERLWPRALLTPFTDDVDLTDADLRAYRMYAATQRFKGFETVHADFGRRPSDEPPAPASRPGDGGAHRADPPDDPRAEREPAGVGERAGEPHR